MMPIALTIAGSDPSGGAGIQADLKTFHQYGVYGTSVLTLLTVQNTSIATDVEYLSASFVLAQLDSVLGDLPPQAAKTGALGTSEVVSAIAARAAQFRFPLVADPVMISKHGARLIEDDARAGLIRELLPHVFLLTPNVPEAMSLSGIDFRGPQSVEDAARAIVDLGAKNVLIKGGHLGEDATDFLYMDGRFHRFFSRRIETRHTHGTGCTYSAAITAGLAKGSALFEAVASAKNYITRAIETNPGLGQGQGPVNHFAQVI
jgi:hydroxymethylpyrimidine/phosphomethylpyrimidine kinase